MTATTKTAEADAESEAASDRRQSLLATDEQEEEPSPSRRTHSLVIVANRLPARKVTRGDKSQWELSPGGLVSALTPVLEKTKGAWVGWSGAAGEAPAPFTLNGIRNQPLSLTKCDIERFYEGFSNRTIWPLYHDAVRPPEYRRRWWAPYVDVNQRYADAAAKTAAKGAAVWI
ncbi:MAG: trehalose-6-phosphate synthase, partial [Planctomycetota bacterium]|nr:trehalose-6-phosphate synthase [Planctomycetota bacterium]